jgi:predicted alpha/beta-hydrolase family hydrolase
LKNAVEALRENLDAAKKRSESARPNPASVGKCETEGGRPNAVFVGWDARIFLGGHSYGGRQSSMLCAELSEKEPDLVAGLLLLSYPLHPPRKPEQQRTQHLPNLRTPTLFIHGTRDPFGSIAELEQAIKMIPAKTKLLPIEGAGHDLGFKGKTHNQTLAGVVFTAFEEFFRATRSPA